MHAKGIHVSMPVLMLNGCMQVLLAWGLKHDTSVIPKTTKVKNLKSNLEVLKFELPSEDYKALCQIKPQASLIAVTFTLEVLQFKASQLEIPKA